VFISGPFIAWRTVPSELHPLQARIEYAEIHTTAGLNQSLVKSPEFYGEPGDPLEESFRKTIIGVS
jgi:hypothetical protein